MNALKGYRTLILVAIMELFALWQSTAPTDIIPIRWLPFATGAFGIAFGVLRFLTTTPAGQATPSGLNMTDADVQALIAEIEARFEPKLVATHTAAGHMTTSIWQVPPPDVVSIPPPGPTSGNTGAVVPTPPVEGMAPHA